MVDVTAGQGNASTRSGLPSFSDIGTMLKRGDCAGIRRFILVVLILPLPQ